MSSNPQYPPQQGGGRGGGRGGNYYPGGGRGGGGAPRMGAWQPVAPTSLQQAAGPGGYPPQQPPQQQQPQQTGVPSQQQQPPGGPPQQQRGPPVPPQYHPGMTPYYNPYASGAGAYRSSWQPTYPQPAGSMRGGVFYPSPQQQPQQQQQQPMPSGAATVTPPATPAIQPPPPRAKKPLVITDKQGNVIDLTAAAPKKPASSLQQAAATGTTATTTSTTTTATEATTSDAGAKMRQAALERLEAENKAKKEGEDEQEAAKKKQAEEEEEVAKKKQAEEEEATKKKQAEEEAAKKAAEEAKRKEEAIQQQLQEEEKEKAAFAPAEPKKSSLAAMLTKAADSAPDASSSTEKKRIVLSKQELLRLKDLEVCDQRPTELPDMTITRGASRRNSASNRQRDGGGGGGGNWERGQQSRRQSNTGGGGGGGSGGGSGGSGGQWERGQAPPKGQRRPSQRGRNQGPPFFDGPVAPLVKSDNHWKPKKNTSALVIAEKKVKSILNKMTKEKFDRLSQQMMEIPILTYETLNMMIDNVYDKAIDEPAFGEIYADLCVLLSQSVQVNKLVHIIESDEEPPTEDGHAAAPDAEGTHYTVYRWSNDVSTNDSEIVGPLPSEDACFEAALDEEEREPTSGEGLNLELVSVCIRRGIFIKIMKKKDAKEDETDIYYTVYFPVGEAEELGQQMSDIFLSQIECESDAAKKNSFKRSLLNKCEEEFNKQDIYVDWKAEKKAYEESKSSLTEAERAEKEAELNFRRIRIKKQMLGNVKFIGQLYKKRLLKEKIMRYCIASLLKLEELPKEQVKSKNPEYKDSGDIDMDEEDHEAICNMFTTIGSTIDTSVAAHFLDVCFTKIKDLSTNEDVPTRSRFMYKDLIELRANRWVPRRKEEKAKTLEEIRKDVEREERRQAQHSQQQQRGGTRGDYNPRVSGRGGGGSGGGGDYRGGSRPTSIVSRPRQPKPNTETDADGFTTVMTGSKASSQRQLGKPQQGRVVPIATNQAFAALAEEHPPTASNQPKADPLSKEKLERRIKSMRTDFLADGGNVDELMLSMDELSTTPGAGTKVVSANADRIMDCKDSEREAIYHILSILFEAEKLSKDDIRGGLQDAIEFIDSFVMDSPRAFEYLGNLLGDMLRLNAIDVNWLCEQCEKTKVEPKTKAPEKLIFHSLQALKESGGTVSEVVDNSALTGLLGDETWKSISEKLC